MQPLLPLYPKAPEAMNRPLFQAWLYRFPRLCLDGYLMEGIAVGFILAPFPAEEQEPGRLCSALLHVELCIGWRDGRPWIDWYCHSADRGGPQ